MDLRTLQQATRSDHLHARHEKADRLYRLGAEYLQRAIDRDYERSLLRNASNCFAKAIEHNRRDPRAYVQLAYLFLLTGNGQKAVKYLQEAQRLNSEDPRVQELLGHAAKAGARRKMKMAEPRPQPVAGRHGPSPEQIALKMKHLRAQLTQWMDRSYRELQNLQPTWARPVWQGYKNLQIEYDEAYQSICNELDKLEALTDISELDSDLQKLEIALNRLDDVCELSQQMVSLYERIEKLAKHFERQLLAMKSNPRHLAKLQPLLDKYAPVCDELADDLDMLEGSGFNIAALTPGYEKLVQLYQQLDALPRG